MTQNRGGFPLYVAACMLLIYSPPFALAGAGEECDGLYKSCAEDCERVCGSARNDYCEVAGYSGCALDVFCWCNACDIYAPKWCALEGYLGCAEGAKATFKGCIEVCNSKLRAGKDVSTCWKDCTDELSKKLGNPCKDGPCRVYCSQRGFSSGMWAAYTREGGYDSCLCEGKKGTITTTPTTTTLNVCGGNGQKCCDAESTCKVGNCMGGECVVFYVNGYPAAGSGCGGQGEQCCRGGTSGQPCHLGLSCSNGMCKGPKDLMLGQGCGYEDEPCCSGETKCKVGQCMGDRCSVLLSNGYPAQGSGCGGVEEQCCKNDLCSIGLVCSRNKCKGPKDLMLGQGCGYEDEPCCSGEKKCKVGQCIGNRCSVIYMNGHPAPGSGCGGEGDQCCKKSNYGIQCHIGLGCDDGVCKDVSQLKVGDGCGLEGEPSCVGEVKCKTGQYGDGKCSVIYVNGYPAPSSGCGVQGGPCCAETPLGFPCYIGLTCSKGVCKGPEDLKLGQGCGYENEPCCVSRSCEAGSTCLGGMCEGNVQTKLPSRAPTSTIPKDHMASNARGTTAMIIDKMKNLVDDLRGWVQKQLGA